MNIYVKTPRYYYSKFIPHIVEHCVLGKPQTRDDFFAIHAECECIVRSNYTVFQLPYFHDQSLILTQLQQPMASEYILSEMKILKDELRSTTFKQRLFERYGKKYIHQSFNNNRYEKVSLSDIISYKEQWYKLDNMVITDDNDTILFVGSNMGTHHIDLTIPYQPSIQIKTFVCEGSRYYVWEISCRDWRDFVLGFCLKSAINDYQLYTHLTNRTGYDVSYSDFFVYQDRFVIFSSNPLHLPDDKFIIQNNNHLLRIWKDNYSFLQLDTLFQTNSMMNYDELVHFVTNINLKLYSGCK
ncbi:MAG TPA: hypothetical protein PK048_00360 [Candidatus Absconditabacterales bacterium]|nr:hypothetical protein [Candidatus Absconditabacterales bacterium]